LKELLIWLLAQSPSLPILIVVLLIVLLIMVIVKIDTIKKIFGLRVWGKKKVEKRSCRDCILIVLSKGEQYNQNRNIIRDSILDNQMTFASHKIDSLFLGLVLSYSQDIIKARKDKDNPDYLLENKEYLMYQEMLGNALALCKKEIRRSFKENGFHEKEGKEFNDYVKKQAETLISIGRTYIKEKYPSHGMMVQIEDRFGRMDVREIESYVMDVYMNAKDIMIRADNDIKKLKDNFSNDIETFSNVK
jgi:hypothetical protein